MGIFTTLADNIDEVDIIIAGGASPSHLPISFVQLKAIQILSRQE
jgi:hypothetical protein